MFSEFLLGGYNSWKKNLSEVTLGLINDMGYYEANYDYADLVFYGRNSGCDFLNNPFN